MNRNYQEFATEINDLLQNSLNSEYLINPYFRISKATSEQIKRYFFIIHNIPRPFVLFWHFILIPKNILQFYFHLVLSVILFRHNSRFKKNIKDSTVLFLSHGSKRNLYNSKTDTFFELLPNNIRSKEQMKIVILYTSQKWFTNRHDSSLLRKKNPEFTHILLPKFLSPSQNLKYITTINSLALRSLYLGLKFYFDKPVQSRILISSLSSFFSRSTYTNYLLLDLITRSTNVKNLRALFLTFEGHSYEQLLIDNVLRINKKIEIFLRQHSPIVPFHYGINFFLSQCNSEINVLTTGVVYEQYFRSISTLPKYISIGSTKILNHGFHETAIELQSKKIVYAPEGSYHTSYEFMDLIKKIINNSEGTIHILRLHPDLKLNLIFRCKLFVLKLHTNFMVSSSSLQSDLTGASFLFYRSSAVGLESLNYELVPVFYADSKSDGLNVLHTNSKSYYRVYDSRGALDCIERSHVQLPIKSKILLFNSHFSTIDYSKLPIVINY